MTDEAADEVSIQDIRGGLAIAIRRFQTLAKTPDLEPQAIMNELAETVLPTLDDTLVIVDRLEEFAHWAGGKINEEEDDDESQLLPEDAVRYTDFFQAVIEQAEGSLQGLDADSVQHKALTLMRDEARALLVYTNEITLDESDDGDDEEAPDEGGEKEEDDGRDNN